MIRVACCLLSVAAILILSAASYGQTRPAATRPSIIQSNPVLQATVPPISINLKDATLEDVARALGNATGTTCVAPKPLDWVVERRGQRYRDLYNQRWTLTVVDKPFWEVFEELNRQHEIGFIDLPPSEHAILAFVPTSRPKPAAIRAGDFLIFFRIATRGGRDGPLLLHWDLVADPRLTIVRVTVPILTALDDRKEKLEAATTDWLGSHRCSLFSELSEPPTKLGKTLRSVRGELSVRTRDVQDDVVIRFDCTDAAIQMMQ